MMARSELLARTSDPLDAPLLTWRDPKFVARMFVLGLEDPQEYRRGLEELVSPDTRQSWGDFTVASGQLGGARAGESAGPVPWRVHGFVAHDAAAPDVAYVRIRPAAHTSGARTSDAGTADIHTAGAQTTQLLTLVRLPGYSGRWFVRELGRPSRRG